MSDVALKPLSEYTSGVVSRLAALRRQIAVWFWVDGLVRVMWLGLALVAADLVLDWIFRMDRAQRMVMLVLMVGGISYVAYRRLVKPLSANLSDDALALQVEAGNKQLGQAMISALQLSRLENVESRGMSPVLVHQTVLTGTAASQSVDFGSVLDNKEFRLNAVLLTLAILALGGLAIGIRYSESLNIWFNRNVLLGERTWPQDTYLVIERAKDGKVVFPRGEDWTQLVTVRDDSKVIPDAVYIDFRRARGRPAQAMKKTSERGFEAVFNNVIDPFEFRARGGDATTDWVSVELVEQPSVETLKIVVMPPAYTGQTAAELPPGKGPYYVLPGSSLKLEGTANKPLVSAKLQLDGKLLLAPQTAEGQPPAPRDVKRDAPLTLTKETAFVGSVKEADLIAGQYTFLLEDKLGLTGRRPTSLSLIHI